MKITKKDRKKIRESVSVVLVLAVMGSNICYQETYAKAEKNQAFFGGSEQQSFSEEGTTQMGTISQLPEFSTSGIVLEAEEVYVAAGDTVEEGDALYKITDESITTAIAYYENKVKAAEDALETANMDYEAGKLEAEYEKQDILLDAESAKTQLDASLLDLEDSVEEKLEEWEQAKEDISTYTDMLSNNTYYVNAGIEDKTADVTTAEAAVTSAQTEYDTAKQALDAAKQALAANIASLVSATGTGTGATESGTESTEASQNGWSEENIQSIQSLSTTIEANYNTLNSAEAALEEKEKNLDAAKMSLQEAQKSLEEATMEYEKNTEDAEQKLEELESRVDGLQADYEAAARDAQVQELMLTNEYDKAVLNGTYADTIYASSLSEYKTAVNNAQNTLDELKEMQEVLLGMKDGVIYADESGTLAAVTYEAEDYLMADTALVTYYDTSVLTISVEISQEDIAKVAVGDVVTVNISGNRRGNVEGVVQSVASTATTGGSVSNVNYTVVIAIDNTEAGLSSGSSATVVFEYE